MNFTLLQHVSGTLFLRSETKRNGYRHFINNKIKYFKVIYYLLFLILMVSL